MKKIIKWIIIIITVLIFLYAFSSSYNSQNIDRLDYVIAICIDTVPNTSDLKISFEFANLSSFSETSKHFTQKLHILLHFIIIFTNISKAFFKFWIWY